MNEKDFIKEYKELFDGIKAGEELRDKILRQKKPKRNKFRPIVATIATTAAAIAIFTAVHNYSFEPDDSGIISTVTVSETESPKPEKQPQQTPDYAAEDTEHEQESVNPPKKTAYNSKNESSSVSGNIATPAPPRITPRPHSEPRQNAENLAANKTTPVPETSVAAPSEETIKSDTAADTTESISDTSSDKGAADGSLILPFRTGTVTLRMAAESILTDIILQSMQQSEEPDSIEEYHTEQWDNTKYFNYIGNDILNNIRLGSDMAYAGGSGSYFTVSSDGKLKDDRRIFVFSGSGRRSVSILTSRDTSLVDAVLSSPEIDKKNVSDIEMTAFGSDLTYFFYIKSNGIAYIITTESLDGGEIAELISSIS